MDWFGNVLSGGFLKGHRSFIIAATVIIGVLGQWAVGDIGLLDLLKQDWTTMLLGIGIGTAAVHRP